MHEALRFMLLDVALDANIREQDGLLVATTSKRHSQEMTYGAVRPVTSQQVIATNLFGVSSVKPNTGRDSLFILEQSHDLSRPLHGNALTRQMLFENTFGLILGQTQSKWIRRVQPAERDAHNPLAITKK